MSDTFDHEAEAWDSLLFNDDDDGQPVPRRKVVQCSKCGKVDLRWKQHPSGKWWLAEFTEGWHTCS